MTTGPAVTRRIFGEPPRKVVPLVDREGRHARVEVAVTKRQRFSDGVDGDAQVRRSLRADPSRVIVGEVLGPEIVTMLKDRHRM